MAQYLFSLVLVLLVVGAPAEVNRIVRAQTGTTRGKIVTHKKTAKARSHTVQPQRRSLEDILTDQSLWGESFRSVVAALPAFASGGESQIWVFPDRVVGGNKFRERDQADRQVRTVNDALKIVRQPRSDKLRAMTAGAPPLKMSRILFSDDRTHRTATEGGAFLRPGLTMADVRRRLGKEERITTVVLDDGTERQPVILTLHHYAGGALAFVESNWNPTIGAVDRVLIDTSKISATLF